MKAHGLTARETAKRSSATMLAILTQLEIDFEATAALLWRVIDSSHSKVLLSWPRTKLPWLTGSPLTPSVSLISHYHGTRYQTPSFLTCASFSR